MSHEKKISSLTPKILIFCISLVLFWEVMSWWSSRPYDEYELTADDFKDFNPTSLKWTIKPIPVRATPTEPNIIAKLLTPTAVRDGMAVPVLVRLVHGFNMVDCMRIKGYKVELISDTHSLPTDNTDDAQEVLTTRSSQTSRPGGDVVNLDSYSVTDPNSPNRSYIKGKEGRIQVWRLTAGTTGDVSIWVTSMLQSSDFAGTMVDVRDMPFPRIGIPVDPNWQPTGLTWKSMKHPVRNLKWFFRAKWNNSRRDVLTFLRLKQPAWASGEMLTLVSVSKGVVVKEESEGIVTKQVLLAHDFLHNALKAKSPNM